MRKQQWVSHLLAGAMWILSAAHAQEPLGTVSNAATVLRRAIDLMPELTAEQTTWLRNGTGLVDESHAELLQKVEPSLQLLYRAAGMPECYWELPWEEEGFNTKMTHLGPMRNLASMAQRHAEVQLPGNPEGFLDDTLVALSTARHVGRDGPLISLLVEYAMESRAVESLARHLPDLPQDALASLAAQWELMPPGGNLHAAMSMEKALGVDWFIKKIRQAMEKVQAGRTRETQKLQTDGAGSTSSSARSLADEFRMSGIIEIDGLPIRIGLETKEGASFFLGLGQEKYGLELVSADFEREEAVLVKDGQATLLKLRSGQFLPLDLRVSEEVLAEVLGPGWQEIAGDGGVSPLEMLEETSADYGRLVEALSLPPEEFRQWHADFEDEIARGNPFSRLLLPAISNARERADGVRVRRQMLMTAIEVMRVGPEAVEDSEDPFGNGPFAYRETDGGFELVSTLTVKGKPVTLAVGNSKQP